MRASPPSERVAVLVAALAACAGPPPDPPALELVELTPIASPLGDHVLVLGLPGSTEPRIDVLGVDLDAALDPVAGRVAADGSFLLEIPGREGDRLRLATERAGRRSIPLDVVAAFGAAEAAPIDLPCLRVPALLELGGALVVENACEARIVIEEIALRAPASLAVRAETPLSIEPGSERVIELARQGAEPVDEVLLLTVSEPAVERRAITVVWR